MLGAFSEPVEWHRKDRLGKKLRYVLQATMFGNLHSESFTDNTLSNADKNMIHKNKCYSANASRVLRVV